jgi:hypothetical protein
MPCLLKRSAARASATLRAAQAIADEFDKGSTHVFDTIFNSQAQPPSPVPSRAALAEPP